MRHAPAFFIRNFRCRYLNALINLHRVAIDNFAAETQRDLDPERALAGSGWANDCDRRNIHTREDKYRTGSSSDRVLALNIVFDMSQIRPHECRTPSLPLTGSVFV